MIYTGKTAKEVCNAILQNEDYKKELEGYETLSSGYWYEDGKYVAYDNTTGDCWVEEFSSKAQAVAWIGKDIEA